MPEIGDRGPYGRVWNGEKWGRVPKETAAPAPSPHIGQTVDMSSLAAVIQQAVEAATAPLHAEIAAIKEERLRSTPSFIPMEKVDLHNTDQRRKAMAEVRAMNKSGQERDGISTLPSTMSGQRIPEQMLHMFPKQYPPGAMVRIRPEVHREGWAEGRIWEHVLGELGIQGVGVVRSQFPMGKSGEWKYKVSVPGLTPGKRGDGFYHYELELLAA